LAQILAARSVAAIGARDFLQDPAVPVEPLDEVAVGVGGAHLTSFFARGGQKITPPTL
jgi:hypothetical protein